VAYSDEGNDSIDVAKDWLVLEGLVRLEPTSAKKVV